MPSERIQRQIDRILDQAEQALEQSQWDVVRERALAVLRLDPENSDAATYLAAAERPNPPAPFPHREGGATTADQPHHREGGATTADQPHHREGGATTADQPHHREGGNGPPSPSRGGTGSPKADQGEVRTSFVNGRYVVIRFLGEGGKKKVYLAHDTLLDRDVAFALIKTDGLDAAGRARILREAQAMGRLGSHPNIVTVFDIGEIPSSVPGQPGQPYIITELMEGGDVEGLIEKALDGRIPLERALDITRDVGRGLEFAHSRGIIHRDIKPGNVWLTESGVAKIGDFGLALPLDASRLTQAGMMVGTVLYMPPEQAVGGEVTRRSDLYALGAMLYELVTGRPPFLGDDSIAIISQHINTAPVAPSWHSARCPRPLEALILRLLAKDPAQRPDSAADLLRALDAIDLTVTTETPVHDASRILDSLAGGVFVGRQREMGDLRAALEESLSGRGRLVTLVGEPGAGKTRTALELATYAGLRGAQVLWGRCYEGQGVPPYWPWVQAIRSYVRERDPERLRAEMGSGAADIAEIVSDVRERLPGLPTPPAMEEPEAARFRLFDAITAFLKSASRTQPLVLVLDDLHWADRPSLLLLEFLAGELDASRLLVVCTYRDMELNRQHALSRTLGELARSAGGSFQRVVLRGLTQEDVGRFIEVAAGIVPPPGLAAEVHAQTEGNPFFVSEVVRLLVQEGHLTRDVGAGSPRPAPHGRGNLAPTGTAGASGQRWTVRIPEGVREVIGRRLDHLSERANQVLTVAAVIGREFELAQLARVADDPAVSDGQPVSTDRLLETLEEAVGARVIEELPRTVADSATAGLRSPGRAGRYQFTHALIQQTLVEELSTTRRVRLHARIALALEALYGAQAEAHAAELAHHFTEAEAVLGSEKLGHYSLLAGERAIAAYAWEEALAHFRRGLAAKESAVLGAGGLPVRPEPVEGRARDAIGPPVVDTEHAALLYGLAQAQAATATGRRDQEEALAALRRAFDYYAGAGDVAQAVTVANYDIFPPATRIPWRTELLAEALRLVPPDSHAAGSLLAHYAQWKGVAEADYEAAHEAFAGALAIARREGDEDLEADTLGRASAVNGQHLRWHESLDSGLRALALSPEVANYFWLVSGMVATGDLEGAKRQAAASLVNAERSRRRRNLAIAFANAAMVASLEGDWRAARDFTDRGLEAVPDGTGLLGRRAVLEYQLGEFAAGEAYLERLLQAMRSALPGATDEYISPALVIPVAARITGDASRLDSAITAAEVVLGASPTPRDAATARTGLALVAVQRGDLGAAEEQYVALAPQRGTMLPYGLICADRLLGLLAQAMGRHDEAAGHFEDAVAFCRKAGYRPELAWSLFDYGDMLLVQARGQPQDGDALRRKAVAFLDEALTISRELGMRPLMERVLSRREILKA